MTRTTPNRIEASSLTRFAWLSIAASILNFIVARILLTAGRRYQSITLEADAHQQANAGQRVA